MTNLTKSIIAENDELSELGTVTSEVIFDRGTEDFRRALSKQLLDSAWTYGKDHQEEMEARFGALQAWERFEPRDMTEALLVAQIIVAHNGVMGWQHMAALETLRPEAREKAANQAIRLLGVFEKLVAALDKHRGKGRQKIKVKRVTVVESGGQAIVGNVQTPAIAAAGSTSLPPPLPAIDQSAVLSPKIRVRSRTRRDND
jgi:hypothetical protein